MSNATTSAHGFPNSSEVTSLPPCYNSRPEYSLCHSNGHLIDVPWQTSAASWAVITAFKSILDTIQFEINGWRMSRSQYPPKYEAKRDAGRATAIRLINYWTFGTDRAKFRAEETRRNIRSTIWDWEESQGEVPDYGDNLIDKIRYHRNCRALDEAIGARSWLEPRIQNSVGGTFKTDVDIQQVAIYLEKEYELLSKSLKQSHISEPTCKSFITDLNTLYEPLRIAAEQFIRTMGGDPVVAALVKSKWTDSHSLAFRQPDRKSQAGPVEHPPGGDWEIVNLSWGAHPNGRV